MLGNKGRLRRMVRRVVKEALEKRWAPLSPEDLASRCAWVLSLEPAKRPLRVWNRPEMARPEVVTRLVQQSYALRHTDPTKSLRLAEAAVDVAEQLRLPAEDHRLVADFQAQAWGNLANCHRLLETYEAAEAAWETTEERRVGGTGDPLLEASLARMKAELRRHQRALPEAHDLYLHSAELFERLKENPEAGKARLGLAINYFYAGNTGAALDEVPRAQRLLAGQPEAEMALALWHNTLLFLEDAGHYLAAQMLLPTIEPWYEDLDSPLLKYRAAWLKCRLHLALDQPKNALRAGELARRGFMAEGQHYDAALCGFDVAFARLKLGGYMRVQKLAREMYPVFTAKGIPREAAATLVMFADAAQAGHLNQALMAKLAAELAPFRRPGAPPATPGATPATPGAPSSRV